MFITILGWMFVTALLMLLGASIYVSFYMEREQHKPIYRAKRKTAFDRRPKGVETAPRRQSVLSV
jgi:hypothetical protein